MAKDAKAKVNPVRISFGEASTLISRKTVKDVRGNAIKDGDLVKKCAKVRYADGKKWKIGRKTWEVKEDSGDVFVPAKKSSTRYLVVGDTTKGVSKTYAEYENGRVFEPGEEPSWLT